MDGPEPPEPARPDPAQPAQADPARPAQGEPAAAGAGASAPGGGGDRRTVLQGQFIVAGGGILAAIIAGVFLVLVTFHHSGGGAGGGGSTVRPSTPAAQTSTPAAQTGVNIVGEQWLAPANGKRVIRVTGTAQDFPVGQVIFVTAGRTQRHPPFYTGGPATFSGNGTWVADITRIPATAVTLKFWWGESPSPIGGFCTPACAEAVYAKDRQKIAVAGPHAAFLTRVGPPVEGHAPGH